MLPWKHFKPSPFMMILFPQACITDNIFFLLARKTKSASEDQFTLSLEDCEHDVGHFMCVPPSLQMASWCVCVCVSLSVFIFAYTWIQNRNQRDLFSSYSSSKLVIFFYETKNDTLINMCMVLIVAIKANIPIPNTLRCFDTRIIKRLCSSMVVSPLLPWMIICPNSP